MTAIIFAVLSLIGWGTGDIFTAFGSRKIGAYNASFYGYLFGLIVATPLLPFFIADFAKLGIGMLILSIVLSLFQILAFFAFAEALKVGNTSIVGTISGAFTSLVVLFSVVFLGEKLLFNQVFSIVIIFVGLILASLNFSDLKQRKALINKGTLLALFAMLGWGVYFTFIKIPIEELSFFWPTYITFIVASIGFFVVGKNRIKKPSLKINSGYPAMLMSAFLLTIGTFCFNFGITQGLSSVVAPIAGAYPALFALLAYFIFKDPITNQQKIGMVITLIGIVLLAVFSS